MKKWRALSLIIATASVLAACASTPRANFYWGSYESSLFAYSKKPDRLPAYKKSLEDAVARGRSKNMMAPGLLAELGYVYLEEGDTNKALALFEEEMSRFPESKTFMSTVIERARSNAKTQKAAAQ
jgi:hypothetical protein